MKKQLTYILFAALGLCAASCTDDAQEVPGVPGTTETVVPLSISFSGEWDTDDMTSRAAPPEQGDTNGDGTIDSDDLVGGTEEIKSIDEATVIVFRRSDPDVTGKPAGDFVYDPTNFQEGLTCRPKTEEEKAADSEHADNYVVEGAQLRKIYGFEYRVIAIAYDGDERAWFKLNNDLDGMTYEQFEMTILEQAKTDETVGSFTHNSGIYNSFKADKFKALFTPQFFYGYCHTIDSSDPIIKYGTTEEEVNQGVTGTLYRAVAKVEVKLTLGQFQPGQGANFLWYDISQIALLMNNVYTNAPMASYDGFLTPKNPLIQTGENKEDNYILIDHERGLDDKKDVTLTAYVLQTKTKLGIAVYKYETLTTYTNQGWFTAKDLSYADGATGVISPDVQGNEFYFRRNHKYVITGSTVNVFGEK